MIEKVEVKRLASALGAEIHGLDLAKVGPHEVEPILEWLHDFKVLFFPGQSLSAAEHVEFGRLFGELEGHPHLESNFSLEEKSSVSQPAQR